MSTRYVTVEVDQQAAADLGSFLNIPTAEAAQRIANAGGGRYLGEVSAELAAELRADDPEGIASPDVIVVEVRQGQPYPGSVPYPLTGRSASLLAGLPR